jgi:hypothetical protein
MSPSDEVPPRDDGGRLGSRLLFFILCLYLPEFALWAVDAKPGSLVLSGFWTPIIPPGLAIAGIAHVDRNSAWPFAAGAFAMILVLYWVARGIARAARRAQFVLTIGIGLLLASYSVWAWWVLLVLLATGKA